MAGRTFHLAFADGHVRATLQLHRLLLVTRLARRRHGRCLELRACGAGIVHAVAGDAGQIARIVCATLPPGVFAARVTRGTGCARLAWRHHRAGFARGPGAFRKTLDRVECSASVDVRLARTVTRLTAMGGGWGAGIGCAGVRARAVAIRRLVRVTGDARISAHVVSRRRLRGIRLRGWRVWRGRGFRSTFCSLPDGTGKRQGERGRASQAKADDSSRELWFDHV